MSILPHTPPCQALQDGEGGLCPASLDLTCPGKLRKPQQDWRLLEPYQHSLIPQTSGRGKSGAW